MLNHLLWLAVNLRFLPQSRSTWIFFLACWRLPLISLPPLSASGTVLPGGSHLSGCSLSLSPSPTPNVRIHFRSTHSSPLRSLRRSLKFSFALILTCNSREPTHKSTSTALTSFLSFNLTFPLTTGLLAAVSSNSNLS